MCSSDLVVCKDNFFMIFACAGVYIIMRFYKKVTRLQGLVLIGMYLAYIALLILDTWQGKAA